MQPQLRFVAVVMTRGRVKFVPAEFHPKTSLPMARCPKSGKLSRFAFGPVAVPSSVALARFGGSQAHRDHLQPPKIFHSQKILIPSFVLVLGVSD